MRKTILGRAAGIKALVRRTAGAAAAGIIVLGLLAGCGSSDTASASGAAESTAVDGEAKAGDEGGTPSDREKVSVALWGAQLMESYSPWLQEQFPDVDFDFYTCVNSTDYYHFWEEHDGLPDIMTVRKFSLRDVESMKDELLDLSDTELANTFYQSYLRNYTYADGVVNWLPTCAEIDSIIINKTLFDENNIPVPTDYESFKYACGEFEKLGITGFITDMKQNYSCMEILQGLSIAQFTSMEGREWRQLYESRETDGLSEDVWMPAFEKMLDFINSGCIDEYSLEIGTTEIQEGFDSGEIAMYRGTGSDFTSWGTGYERMILPFPGDTEEDSWFLTYPAFQVAASASGTEDAERKDLILDILTAMLSEEGLKHISEGMNMLAYNKGVELELSPGLDNVKPYIESNSIYTRLASNEMFNVSQDVVQRMIKGEFATAREAYDEFNRQMLEDTESEAEKTVSFDTGYSRKFSPEHGNEAASAVYNTLREALEADCVLGSSAIMTGDILPGEYSDTEVYYMINWEWGNLLKLELTGDELKGLVQYMLDAKESRDTVANDSTLPTSSGFEMTISGSNGAYTAEALTIDGEPIDGSRTYSVVMRVTYAGDFQKLTDAGFEYERLDVTVKDLLKGWLVTDGRQLAAPTDYIVLK